MNDLLQQTPKSDLKHFKGATVRNLNKRYKPAPKYKIFTATWYNPFFWLAGSLFPILYGIYQGIKSMIDAYSEFYHGIFKYNLK